MALSSAKHEAIHDKTGSDLAAIKANFDNGKHLDVIGFPAESAIIYQIQKIQDELDYLRTEISSNKGKVSMTLGTSGSTALAGDTSLLALGTSGSTALAGDTTTISTAQANEITASTSHNAKLNVAAAASLTKSTAITFGEFTTTVAGKTTTYSLPVTVVETTVGKKGNTTLTKTGAITLT